MKYSNTAITQLTRWYKQILVKCAILNAAILMGGAVIAAPAMAETVTERQVLTQDATLSDVSASDIDSGSKYGGVYYIESGNITINGNSVFLGNNAKTSGAIELQGSKTESNTSLTIKDSSFIGNTATTSSGAIETWTRLVDLNIDNTTFNGNSAPTFGAVSVFGKAGVNTISNSHFINNEATATEEAGGDKDDYDHGDGGAIYLGSESKLKITNTEFSGNSGGMDGGAIATRNEHQNQTTAGLEIAGSTFEGNTAGQRGGAIYANISHNTDLSGAASISSSTFDSNSAKEGAAIYNDYKDSAGNTSSLLISDSSFTNNAASENGGAIYNKGIVTLAGVNTFSGNTANGNANDIYNAGTLNIGGTATLDGGIDGPNGIVNVTDGTVDVGGYIRNQTVTVSGGELHLSDGEEDGSNLSGSTVTVASGATINTIDGTINDYMSKVTLQDGAKIALDLKETGDYLWSDLYNSGGGNYTVTKVNLLGTLSNTVGEQAIYVTNGGTVAVANSVKETVKAYTSTGQYTLADGTEAGTIKLTAAPGTGGLNNAVAGTDVNKEETVAYQMTANENFADNADTTIARADFALNGNGNTITSTGADSMKVADDSTLLAEDVTFAGFTDAAIDNKGGEVVLENVTFDSSNNMAFKNSGVLTITNSVVNADVYNSGKLYSDPTTYSGVVTNEGEAVFDDDIFETTAQLDNTGTVDLLNTVQFQGGAQITGDGDLNLRNGSTTQFAAAGTMNENDVYVEYGADYTGKIVGGSINTQNGQIDNISGGVDSADLYIDANLNAGTVDNFAGGANATIKEIDMMGFGYGTADTVDLAVGSGAALDANVKINGTNYFTDIAVDDGTLTFSNKLINSSALHNQLGDWVDGNYISASNTYNTTKNSYATDGQTVAGALAALDDGIGAKQAGTYISDTASVNANLAALDTALDGVADDLAEKATLEQISGNYHTLLHNGNGAIFAGISAYDQATSDENVIQVYSGKPNVADESGIIIQSRDAGTPASTIRVNKDGAFYTTATTGAVTANDEIVTLATAKNGIYSGTDTIGDTLDDIINDMTVAADGDYIAAGTDVAANLGSLDGALAALADDVADNTSDITALETTVGDATGGLVKDVADLQTTVGDATGGLVKDVADNATAITNIVNGTTAITYDNSTSGLGATTLGGAIDELASDITVTTAGNYIAAGADVAANLGLLDTALDSVSGDVGDITKIQTPAVVARGNLSNGTTTAPADIVTAIANMDLTMGQIHGLAATITDADGAQNLEQGSTVSGHLLALAGAIGDRTDYSGTNYLTNNQDIATSLVTLDGALGDVEDIVGPAQTAASGVGQFATRKIGDDINLVDAVDELGQNMVSLTADNVFTGLNTFKNDGGIAIQDGAGANSTRIKATADGLNVDRNVEATGFKISGQAPVVTSIDTDGTTVTSAATAANVMATSATVYNGAENGLYDGAKVKGDTTATHTIKTAIAATNGALNALTTTNGDEIDSSKVDVQWNSTDSTLNVVLGNGVYASTNNIAAGDSVTLALGELDAVVGDVANVANANGNIAGADVAAKLDSIDVNMGDLSNLTTTDQSSLVAAINEANAASSIIDAGIIGAGTAGSIQGETLGDGTGGTITVRTALENVNATNVSQNGSMNSLAGLINGGTVDASTGAYTAGADTLDAGFTATNLTAAANELLADFTNGTIDAVFNSVTTDSLTIDQAYAITGATTGKLDMGGNELQNIKALQLVDAGGDVNLTVNGSGDLVVSEGLVADSLESLGDLTVAGDASVGGDLGVTGDASVGGDLDVTGTANVGALEIGATGYGITSTGAAKMDTVEAVNGLTVGGANAITGAAASLDMGANDLTNIKDLTTTGDATIGGDASVAGDFSVAGDTSLQDTTVTGDLVISDGTNDATLNVQYVTATGYDGTAMADNLLVSDTGLFVDDMVSSTHGFGVFDGTTMKEVFDIDDTGSISSDMLKTDSAANTVTLGDSNAATPSVVDVEGQLILNSDGGATEYVDAIDDGTTAATSAGANNDHTMATLASVLKSAENGDYTTVGPNITAATTIGDAINTLDVEIGADTDYTTTINGVAGTNTVKTNIDNVNLALGDVSTVDVNGYAPVAPATKNLTDAVSALNDNMEAVLGAIYKADGTYDDTQLADDGFVAGQADLTASLQDYAANVETATGGTFAADGTWSATVDNTAGSNSYAYVASADLMNAVNQVASNVGQAAELAPAATPVAGGLANNGVAATNTVNANIGYLNAALGDVATLSTSTTDNLRTGGTGGTDPETAVEALQNIDATLGQIHGLQSTSALGANSNLKADAATVSVADHLDSLDSAIGDRTLASSNAAIDAAMNGTSVAAGLQAAGNAIGDMNFATTKYVTAGSDLSDAVRTLDSNMYRIETDLKDLRKEFKNGMASMSAMSALVPNPRATGNTSLSVGTGLYSGHTAVAVGGFHYLTDNVMLNAGAAWGNANDISYRMGITWSW